MKFTTNAGVRIAYDVQGSGPPLVLIHANTFDHRLWLYQVAELAHRFRVINLDLRGYGESDKPVTPFTVHDMVADVFAVLQSENAERAIFMGASVGACLALQIAADHPGRVRGMVLVGAVAAPAPSFPDRIAGYLSADPVGYHRRHIRTLVAPGFPETPLGDWLLRLFTDHAPPLVGPSIAQIFRALMDFDVRDRLPSIGVPALVVNGEYDSVLELGREIARALPEGHHITLPGTGHECLIEDPGAFERAVTTALDAWRNDL